MAGLTLGVVQARSGIDPHRNAAFLVSCLERLAADGAEFVFTPEMSGLLDRQRERVLETAGDEASDPVLAAVRDAAARLGLWVNLGSLAIRRRGGDRLLNRGFLIDSAGAIAARYDKLHMFDVSIGDADRYRESATYTAGDRAVVASTPWGRLGLTICYDLRFPLLYERLARAGAALIAVPAAFTVPTGQAHWHTLLRARAIETGCFVVAPAQSGTHEDGRSTYGHSLVVDPWGEVLLDMGEEPGATTCRIDLDRVELARRRIPALAHRREFTLEEV